MVRESFRIRPDASTEMAQDQVGATPWATGTALPLIPSGGVRRHKADNTGFRDGKEFGFKSPRDAFDLNPDRVGEALSSSNAGRPAPGTEPRHAALSRRTCSLTSLDGPAEASARPRI